ncbi:hypothetical protein BDD12DRAFT_805892 [Trichophaea hybrida]|nr:hypothetical protein BDD12DRAFT_805892 [Trichophaea hybrida]
MYWVDIESRVRHDATVSSEIKLAFNTAQIAWISSIEGFLEVLYYGRFVDDGNCAAALLLARSMIPEPERGSLEGALDEEFDIILDLWIATTRLEIGYFSALCWQSSAVRWGGNTVHEVEKPIILHKQVSTLLASAFRSYGSHKFEGKK